MHDKLIELLAKHEASDYFTQLTVIRDTVSNAENGLDDLGYWVGEFEDTSLYNPLMQVFFELSFEKIKALIIDENMDMEVRLHSAICFKWFRDHDFSVDIAINTLGTELFEKLESTFIDVQREMYSRLIPEFTGRKRSSVLKKHREFIKQEFGQSRYLMHMLELFDGECNKLEIELK
ncbi:hypothetical protein LMH73_019225 [Vibrio splendidus]|nr:hypothetical protein [Vibrio splendidus]MCC4880507.1 hypothetical protein [Vibrio splendidus]